MAQTAKMIDVSRSYIPIDPNTYAANLALSRYQDAPDQASPIVAYDGKNFIPTISGYKSYFGIDRAVQTDSLPSRADHVISFQNAAYQNILVAMCEDGIYIKHGADYGNWVKKAAVEVSATYKEWSYCVLGDSIYCYRTNDPVYYCIPSALYTKHSALITWKPAMTMATQEASSPYGVPAGTYRFAAASRYSTGWISGVTDWSASITKTATYILIPYVSYPDNQQIVSVRFYIDNGTEIRYKDVVPSSSQYDTALCSVSQADWNAMQVVTSVPDEDWLSLPFTEDQPVLPITPAFLNMTGQLGIFSAGTRLGFWDSEDSVSWSSIDDYTDFTPSLTTLAGSSIFSDVQGRIVTIERLGDGFVIYSTQSIVYVKKSESSLLLWEPEVLMQSGLSYRKQVTAAGYKKEHWAWTRQGLTKITQSAVEVVVPEILDLMKKHNSPVYLDMLDDRYLMLQIMDEDFYLRNVLSSTVQVPSSEFPYTGSDTVEDLQERLLENIKKADFCAFESSIHASQLAAASNLNTIVDVNSYAPIYDWKLNVQNAISQASSNAWIRQYSLGLLEIRDTAWLAGSGTTYGPLIEWKPLPRGLISDFAQSSPMDGISGIRQGTAYAPLNSVASFIKSQIELWKRQDKNTKATIKALPSRKVSFSNSIEYLNSYVTGSGPANYYEQWKKARIESMFAESASYFVYEVDAERYLHLQYGPAELDISDCAIVYQRQCSKVAKLIFRKSFEQFMDIFEISNISYSTGQNSLPSIDAILADLIAGLEGRITDLTTSVIQQPIDALYSHIIHYEGTRVSDGQHVSADIEVYFSAHLHYKHRVKTTVWPEVGQTLTGKFDIAKATMSMKGWYNKNTGQSYDRTSGCAIPMRTALGDGTHRIDPPVNEQTGALCSSIAFNSENFIIDVSDEEVGTPLTWTYEAPVSLPPTEFMLQEGSPAPAYPTFYGAYVYDLFLKKWGKLDQEYSLLLNYSAINGQNGEPVSFNAFQMKSGVLDSYGAIRLFDDKPSESFIRYGKVGYDRKGFTAAEEVRVGFSSPSTCTVTLEPSITGFLAEKNLADSVSVVDSRGATLFANLSARWYNVVVSGKYDINYLEFRGHSSGRR